MLDPLIGRGDKWFWVYPSLEMLSSFLLKAFNNWSQWYLWLPCKVLILVVNKGFLLFHSERRIVVKCISENESALLCHLFSYPLTIEQVLCWLYICLPSVFVCFDTDVNVSLSSWNFPLRSLLSSNYKGGAFCWKIPLSTRLVADLFFEHCCISIEWFFNSWLN